MPPGWRMTPLPSYPQPVSRSQPPEGPYPLNRSASHMALRGANASQSLLK
jgi:hypothetical protein